MKEKIGAGRNFPKKRQGYAYFIILRFVAEQKSRKKQTGFLKWFFNILLLFLVKILASYRLSLVELLCRINCCNMHVLKPRTVEWNGKIRPSVIKRPPVIKYSWHYFSLTLVQLLRTLLTCFELQLWDVVSLLAA